MDKINPYVAMAMMLGLVNYNEFIKDSPTIDELTIQLKFRKRSLEQEYNLVKQKKSSLSKRLRNQVIYRYENGENK